MPSLSRKTMGWLFSTPALILIFLLVLFPNVALYYLSTFNWDFMLNIQRFIGPENFIRLASDAEFISSLRFTVLFTIVAVVLEFIVGFGLALALDSTNFRGKSYVVIFIFAPIALAPTVVGLTWRMAFNLQYGYVNDLFSIISGQKVAINWLGEYVPATLMLVFADFWQWMPFVFISLYAGMGILPKDLFELATLDGASYWRRVRDLTLPLLRGIIMATLLLRALDALKVFDYIYLTTKGAPGYSTQSISVFIYKVIFMRTNLGYSSASAIIFLWSVMIIIMLFFRFLGQEITGKE